MFSFPYDMKVFPPSCFAVSGMYVCMRNFAMEIPSERVSRRNLHNNAINNQPSNTIDYIMSAKRIGKWIGVWETFKRVWISRIDVFRNSLLIAVRHKPPFSLSLSLFRKYPYSFHYSKRESLHTILYIWHRREILILLMGLMYRDVEHWFVQHFCV